MRIRKTFGMFMVLLVLSISPPVKAEERKPSFTRMEETEIIGIIEHPEVTYIIPKTRIVFLHVPLERNFKDETIREKDPIKIKNDIRLRTFFSTTPKP
jgi:hypothetical protein